MATFSYFALIWMASLYTAFPTTSASCVDSCVSQSNGNYQHCSDCHQYVACSNGYKYNMPCPSNLVWDDLMKQCEWISFTCNITVHASTTSTAKVNTTTAKPPSATTGCVDSCVGQSNGNYQHCSDCHQYVACSNGYKYNMPCPSNLVWDDLMKQCKWISFTCNTTVPASTTSAAKVNTTTAKPTTKITACVDSCVGQSNGNYKHCSDCHQYVACSNGYKYNMPCPSILVWNDLIKTCDWTSPTC